MFAQDSTLIGDVDCSGEVNSQDASLILQFVTNVIDELPCQDNMTGLTPEQLQEIINMMDEQLSINYSGGGASGMPTMISEVSEDDMSFPLAMSYCRHLEENGYTDWFLPTFKQLLYAASGGVEFPDQTPLSDEELWTTSFSSVQEYYLLTVKLTGAPAGFVNTNGSSELFCRCVRFGEDETSEGSSSSSNSSASGSSILGSSEQAITMIGPMYLHSVFTNFLHTYVSLTTPLPKTNLSYFDAIRFCGQLEYNGYDDWFVPSLNQILYYYAENDKIEIPNLAALLDEIPPGPYAATIYKSFWTTENGYGDVNEASITNSSRNQVGIYLPGESLYINAEGWTSSDVLLDLSYMITGISDENIVSTGIGGPTTHGCVCVR